MGGAKGGGSGTGSPPGAGTDDAAVGKASAAPPMSGRSQAPVQGDPASANIDLSQKPKQSIRSLFSLVNTQVSVPGSRGSPTTIYPSPLNDTGTQKQLLPLLFQKTTLSKGTDTPARININTAPQEVLTALTALPGSKLTESDVNTIISTRPSLSSDQAASDDFKTPAWLISQANLDPSKLTTLEKYITTQSQVYRVHVQGMLDTGGLTARVEAVIDTNGGQPRILARRNMSELGKAVDTSAQK